MVRRSAAPWLEGRWLQVVECGAVQIFTEQVIGNVHLPRDQELSFNIGRTHISITRNSRVAVCRIKGAVCKLFGGIFF